VNESAHKQLVYELKGEGIEVTYRPVSGGEQLEVRRDGEDAQTFVGDQIASQKTKVGTLLTVLLWKGSTRVGDTEVTLALLLQPDETSNATGAAIIAREVLDEFRMGPIYQDVRPLEGTVTKAE
jgi:hypothetical protein